jgi:uncharacterized protein (TIGR02444 family)
VACLILMDENSNNPFWTYSVLLYGRDGVAPACLELQDRLDIDVNVLLFCCWAGSRGRALSETEIEGLIAATRPWRDEVVRPLRAVRRWLKTQDVAPEDAAERLREDVKAGELAAEAVQQAMLWRAFPIADGAANPEAVAGNLRRYLAVHGRTPGAADTAALAAILCACCPALAPLDAVRLLEG